MSAASSMIAYKSWLDTRWQFITGVLLLMCGAAVGILLYPQVVAMLPAARNFDIPPGLVGEEIRKAVERSSTFRGYAWDQLNSQNLGSLLTLFPILIGAGGVLSSNARGGLYTLALPVSRRRLVLTRASTGLVEVFVLCLAPFVAAPLAAPAVGETYSLVDTAAYTVCAFFGASVFFSLALWLSTIFSDVWRPLLITVGIAMAMGIVEIVFRFGKGPPIGLYRTMNGQAWFETGELPWIGLAITAAVSVSLIYAAVRNLERRDY